MNSWLSGNQVDFCPDLYADMSYLLKCKLRIDTALSPDTAKIKAFVEIQKDGYKQYYALKYTGYERWSNDVKAQVKFSFEPLIAFTNCAVVGLHILINDCYLGMKPYTHNIASNATLNTNYTINV